MSLSTLLVECKDARITLPADLLQCNGLVLDMLDLNDFNGEENDLIPLPDIYAWEISKICDIARVISYMNRLSEEEYNKKILLDPQKAGFNAYDGKRVLIMALKGEWPNPSETVTYFVKEIHRILPRAFECHHIINACDFLNNEAVMNVACARLASIVKTCETAGPLWHSILCEDFLFQK